MRIINKNIFLFAVYFYGDPYIWNSLEHFLTDLQLGLHTHPSLLHVAKKKQKQKTFRILFFCHEM